MTLDPSVIFYAGIPLVTGDGLKIGTLCVIDNKPKQLSEIQKKMFRSLANPVPRVLELANRGLDAHHSSPDKHNRQCH